MAALAGWITDGWIFSDRADQNAQYWIADDWIWGPVGAVEFTTGYWIAGGRVWGPHGATDVDSGFYIVEGRIWGPSSVLPFVRDQEGGAS